MGPLLGPATGQARQAFPYFIKHPAALRSAVREWFTHLAHPGDPWRMVRQGTKAPNAL